ncbi:MAG: stage II sporulation protein M [Clostridia bacterium]|nr:stage II sporulation protein M [Clostridia bacterium]
MIKELYLQEWERFKKDYVKIFLLIMVISLTASLFFYFFLVANEEITMMGMEQLVEVFEELGMTPGMSQLEMFNLILMQNLRASLVTIALGIIPIVVLPLASPALTTISVSVVMAFVKIQEGNVLNTVLYTILPHGVVELPALFISGSVGVFLSLNVLRKIFPREDEEEVQLQPIIVQAVRTYFLVIVPLIVVAALLESFLTPVLAQRFFV